MEQISNIGYTFSHLVISLILTFCLKKRNPILLAVLLSLILGYVSYETMEKMPVYTLIIFGILIYVINIVIIDEYQENDNIGSKISKNIWKIPFWGIMVHYVIYGYDIIKKLK